jgi:hypothetical protein
LEPGTPSISVRIEGLVRDLIVDTGSNISILQPGISNSELKFSDSRPYGVTGETLDIKGRQTVYFITGGRKVSHQFLVCSLPTEAAGLIEMDFLRESGAIVNFKCNKMSLKDIGRAPRANGTALKKRSAFTIFVEDKEGHSPQPTRREAQRMDKQFPVDSPRKRTSSPARTRLDRARDVTMAPRSQNVVIRKVGFRKTEKTQNAIVSRKPDTEKKPGSLSRDYVQQERSKDAFYRKRKPGSCCSKSEIFLEKDDVKYKRQRKTKPREFEVQELVCLYPTLKHG